MREINYKPPSSSSVFRLGASLLVGLVAIYVLFASWYIVDQGERAVVLRLGRTVAEAGPGPHLKLPWVDNVRKITVQNQNKRYQNLEAYSRDQQPANLTVSVTFVVSNASEIYSQYGDLEVAVTRLIDPRLTAGVKTIFGQYDAVRAIQERAALNSDFASAVTSAISGPINIISVQIENIDFSEAYEQSVEQRMLAQVEIQRREQNLRTTEVEAQIARTRAEGEAEAIRLRGEAEASAIRARADALRANGELVQLQAVEKWDGKLPATMVPNSAMPFINLQPTSRND
ncbi:MAG TPA: SPFH domain-containing protein [Gammaproteobacteria bacterium]|nr:SPFH domain-containing protein [Gammaproteobacteria bacterium]